jgi:predicted DNA binding protein
MAVEASFTATQGEFPLASIFAEFPDTQIELDRVVPTNDAIVPYFWIRGVESELSFDSVSHPGVSEFTIIDSLNDEALIRIDWDFDYESVLTAIIRTDVELISAIGKDGRWTYEVRADDQQAVSAFQSYCQDHDIPITLSELHALSPMSSDGEYDVTEKQREAITLAYARGYFESPREATQDDIADELGISRQALASRLQRGVRRLVASTLIVPCE